MLEKEIIIIGGGLAGLTAAYLLAKAGKNVIVIEKKTYPFHRVCGEYVSNEVRGFLIRENLFPSSHGPSEISRFRLSDVRGNEADISLALGGFGISRFVLDHHFYERCLEMGVVFIQKCQVLDVFFDPQKKLFYLKLDDGRTLLSPMVLGAFGKRSNLDMKLNRAFTKQRSPYVGVKYHVKMSHDDDVVALHNFQGGYFGINKIENGSFNLCYLAGREQLKSSGSIEAMEERYLFSNPRIKEIYDKATFLWERPEVINEISFSPKMPIENHMMMLGDAAGMITPLCGNGMAIAIHTGKIAAESVINHREMIKVHREYQKTWSGLFKTRLSVGRKVQGLFGASIWSNLSVNLIRHFPNVAEKLIRQTHGREI
ncbi:MAG: FAD-dependent oxidoreductase [Cyclobacteriaceae bacterium]